MDIDHFKSINDRHGHLIGDETLRAITANLREAVVEPALFGRLGGEEFAAVLPATDLEQAITIAERLRERVMRIDLSRWLGDRRITVSIGMATSVPTRDSISIMLRRADTALYAAKDAGRNCVRTHTSDRGAGHAARRLKRATCVRRAATRAAASRSTLPPVRMMPTRAPLISSCCSCTAA